MVPRGDGSDQKPGGKEAANRFPVLHEYGSHRRLRSPSDAAQSDLRCINDAPEFKGFVQKKKNLIKYVINNVFISISCKNENDRLAVLG